MGFGMGRLRGRGGSDGSDRPAEAAAARADRWPARVGAGIPRPPRLSSTLRREGGDVGRAQGQADAGRHPHPRGGGLRGHGARGRASRADILDAIGAAGRARRDHGRARRGHHADGGRGGRASSATIGYKGYRHASCISVNHVVCHGIPGDKVLKDGDVLNIDVTVIVDGWYGDSLADVRGRHAQRGRPSG